MSLAEEPYWTALIIAARFQSVLASSQGEAAHASARNARGGGLTRHPSTNSAPAGATDAGTKLDGMGTGAGPVPLVRTAGGGDGCRRGAPFGQALPSHSATNFVASPDFTRMRIVRLPSFCASLSALRMSAGLATFLPPTSRMTSPVLTPWSEPIPLGSTSVTTTPSEPLPATWPAGTTVRPRRGTSVPSGPEESGVVIARASR